MKKRLLSILLALTIIGGLLTAFAAVASSDDSHSFSPARMVCEKCGNGLTLVSSENNHCVWVCENLGCVNAGKEIIHKHTRTILSHPDCRHGTYGVARYSCNVCGYQNDVKVPGTHKAILDVGYNATCTKPGKTTGRHCAICGTVIQPQKVIPALGHNYKIRKITVQPTCAEDGEGIAVCTRCGSKKTVAIKGRHKYVNIPLAGRTFSVCSVCGDVKVKLSNAKARNAADKARELVDELIWENIEEFYGKEIDEDTKFKVAEAGKGLFQLCIDRAADGKKAKLFALPMFAVFPNDKNAGRSTAKPVTFKVPLENLDIKNLDKATVVFITGKDKFEEADGEIVGDNFVFESKTPGFLAALKDDSIMAKIAEAAIK